MPKKDKKDKKEKKGKKKNELEEHPGHPGFCCMYLGDKDLQKWDMKTGDGILDIKAFKFLAKADVLGEIKEMGKLSVFEPQKAFFERYDAEEILFVWDVDKTKEEDMNFYWPNSAEKLEETKTALGIADGQDAPDEGPDEAELARLAKEEEDRKEQIRIAEEVKKKISGDGWIPEAGAWKSLGSEKEVEAFYPEENRPRIRLQFSKPRKDFNQDANFHDVESGDCPEVECRQHTVKEYDLQTKQIDAASQPANATKEGWSNTPWYRQINKTIQYEAQTCTPGEIVSQLNSKRLLEFMKRAVLLVEEALVNNEVVDIFSDDIKAFDTDEQLFATETEALKEVQTFVDLDWSRGKRISKIDWVANNNGMAGVACQENMVFDDRIEISGQSRVSTILVWNLRDVLLRAQMVLTTPDDITNFAFNPYDDRYVIAGLETGQVVMWDIKDDWAELEARLTERREAGAKKSGQSGGDGDEEGAAKLVHTSAISYLEKSHELRVQDIMWLPQGCTVDKKGTCTRTKGKLSWQFMTIAGDGNLLFWDVRDIDQEKWVPVLKMPLKEGTNALGCVRMCYTNDITRIALVTEKGRFKFAKWSKKFEDLTRDPDFPEEDDDDPAAKEKMLSATGSLGHHHLCCSAVQISPHFPDIFLTVGDWSFRIWKEGLEEPLFTSNSAASYLTCGAWSPTRPAVVLTAKEDGTVDVWDLVDQTHAPVIADAPITSCSISDLIFQPRSDPKKQLVAVGDAKGNLRVLEIPRSFSRPHSKEIELMEAFYEREQRTMREQRERDDPEGEAGERSAEKEKESKKTKVVLTQEEADEQAEAKYRDMIAGFKKKLAI